jgi:hypothetical protein
MFRFTIRDVLWLTLVAALGVGWWLDQRAAAWRYEQSVSTMTRLWDRLDEADPGWRERGEAARMPVRVPASPINGYILGAVLFGLAILIVISVSQGRIHSSLLNDVRR